MTGRVGLCLVAVLCGAGCGGGSVPVAVPTPPDTVRAVCERLAPSLPATVLGQKRHTASPASPLTAVWGDPPIALRCGVPRPAAYSPTVRVDTVNGIDWLPEQRDGGYVYTTVGRTADVEVRVPAAYAPEINALADLSGAVSQVPAVVR